MKPGENVITAKPVLAGNCLSLVKQRTGSGELISFTEMGTQGQNETVKWCAGSISVLFISVFCIIYQYLLSQNDFHLLRHLPLALLVCFVLFFSLKNAGADRRR